MEVQGVIIFTDCLVHVADDWASSVTDPSHSHCQIEPLSNLANPKGNFLRCWLNKSHVFYALDDLETAFLFWQWKRRLPFVLGSSYCTPLPVFLFHSEVRPQKYLEKTWSVFIKKYFQVLWKPWIYVTKTCSSECKGSFSLENFNCKYSRKVLSTFSLWKNLAWFNPCLSELLWFFLICLPLF